MIRVISGTYKGKKLKRVPSSLVRPMPDKLKQSLFNILHDEIKGAHFLDGFAGTGSVGIEALSRGAGTVVFIDEYYPAIKVLRENLARCGAEDQARVIHREFNRAIIRLSKEGVGFDLIFLDPPYKLLEDRDPLKVLAKRAVVNPGGKIILRHYRKIKPRNKFFRLKRSVTLGDDTLSFYILNASCQNRPS
jgi:16S rRNA (guanine(966)-N(2))-methyltransferase RsmD